MCSALLCSTCSAPPYLPIVGTASEFNRRTDSRQSSQKDEGGQYRKKIHTEVLASILHPLPDRQRRSHNELQQLQCGTQYFDSFRSPVEPQLIKTWNEKPPQATAANTVDTFVEDMRKKHQPSRRRDSDKIPWWLWLLYSFYFSFTWLALALVRARWSIWEQICIMLELQLYPASWYITTLHSDNGVRGHREWMKLLVWKMECQVTPIDL